jgi:hypothetical protein
MMGGVNEVERRTWGQNFHGTGAVNRDKHMLTFLLRSIPSSWAIAQFYHRYPGLSNPN